MAKVVVAVVVTVLASWSLLQLLKHFVRHGGNEDKLANIVWVVE